MFLEEKEKRDSQFIPGRRRVPRFLLVWTKCFKVPSKSNAFAFVSDLSLGVSDIPSDDICGLNNVSNMHFVYRFWMVVGTRVVQEVFGCGGQAQHSGILSR